MDSPVPLLKAFFLLFAPAVKTEDHIAVLTRQLARNDVEVAGVPAFIIQILRLEKGQIGPPVVKQLLTDLFFVFRSD